MADKQYTQLQLGFDVRTAVPVDRRLVLTRKEMESGEVNWNGLLIQLDNILPENYFTLCSDNNKLYIYNKSGKKDEDDTWPLVAGDHFRLADKVTDVLTYDVDDDGSKNCLRSALNEDGVANVVIPEQLYDARVALKARINELKEELALLENKVEKIRKQSQIERQLKYIDGYNENITQTLMHSSKGELMWVPDK